MINLYKIPTVITWNTWYTPTFFILTTSILGIVGITSYILIFNKELSHFKQLSIILIILLTIEAIVVSLNWNMYSQLSIPNSNLFLLEGLHLKWIIVRLTFIITSAVLTIIIRKKMLQTRNFVSINKLFLILIIILLAEQFLGRFLFSQAI